MLHILGAMSLSYVGIALVLGGAVALGIYAEVIAEYGSRMLANALVGGVVILMLLPYAALVGGVPLRGFGFGWERRDAATLALGALVTLALHWAYIWGLDRLGVREVSAVAPVWALIGFAVVGHAGTFFEELLFRGYVLTRLRRLGVGRAILISAVLFCIVHIPVRGVSHLVLSWLVGGLVYGYVYVRSGSIWVAGGFHLLHNVAADLFLYSDNDVALVQFAVPLGLVEKLAVKLLLAGLVVLLTLLIYGRGRSVLEPAPRLAQRWAELDTTGGGAAIAPAPASLHP